MDTVVQHAGAWTVESVQLDLDDTGPRQWNLVARPGEQARWCTTSELHTLLRAAGLDIADLVLSPRPVPHFDGQHPRGRHEPDAGRSSDADEDPDDDLDEGRSEDTDDECE